MKIFRNGVLVDEASAANAQPYHGIESIGTVSFSNANKTVNVSGATTYWYKGVEVVTGALSCDLDLSADRDHASATLTTNTLYYFYFKDATGKLYWSPTAWDFKEVVSVATVFWNGSAGAISKEWHNHTRDLDWHKNTHLTIGTRYYTGLDLTKPTTTADGELDIATGYLYDEDLLHTITNPTTARAWYKASAGVYTFADIALPYTGTLGDCYYLDTGTYALTTATASKYVCYWVYGTGDQGRPIYIIPTHAAAPYNTIGLARAESVPALYGFGLNPEMKLLYRFIYRGDGEFQEATDYRLASSLPAGAVPAPAASSVTAVPSGLVTGTNVQTILTELEALFHPTDLPVTTGVTNFPAASAGQWYKVSTAGWLGGAAGVGEYVNVGDLLVCVATTIAGTKAAVYTPPGAIWVIIPAMISMPDTYRAIEIASNTGAPTLTNGLYWLNNVLYKVENSVHQSLGVVEDDRLTVTFDGGGTTAIAANKKAVMTVPFNCTITGGQLLASKALGTAGVVSIAIDIWREATATDYDGASSHPAAADSITAGGTKPTVTAANRAAVSVASWASVTLLKGEVLVFNVDSVTDTVLANLTLYVTKN